MYQEVIRPIGIALINETFIIPPGKGWGHIHTNQF